MSFKSKKPWADYALKTTASQPPYAYMLDEDDPDTAIPDPSMVPLVDEAMDYLESGHSSRRVAAWLTEKTGKSISHQSVINILHRNRPDAPIIKKNKKKLRKSKPKTKEGIEVQKAKRRIADAKRTTTMAQAKIDKHEKKSSASGDLDFSVVEKQEKEVVFSPNPGPQTDFLAASEREVLYGGAAGGGKSYALLADPMRYFDNKNFVGIILRRTNDELRELIWKSRDLYTKAFPGAKFAEKKSMWTMPSGATLWMTYLEREEDVMRYQGLSFSWIGWDELTQHRSPFAFNYMRSRLRSTDTTLPLSIRATTNPGGPGHGWVRDMFITPAPAGDRFDATDSETGKPMVYPDKHEKAGQALFQRKFIPALLSDNPHLAEGGQYESNLLALPENQRRQLLEGDWSVADGAAFSEWNSEKHTCKPFDIPSEWRKFRACDFGYSTFSACLWFAVDPAFETLYVYRELYVSKHTGKDLARAINEAEKGESIAYGVLDSSTWHQRGTSGPTVAEEIITNGCRFRPSDRSAGSRVAGKNQVHERLKIDEVTEVPGMIIFDSCRQLIADLPIIPACPKGTDDVDQKFQSDHTYDALRYGVMTRPRSSSPFDFGTGTTVQSYRPADTILGY